MAYGLSRKPAFLRTAAGALIMLLAWSPAARCQTGPGVVTMGDSVMTRPRTDYDAIGLPVGGFRLYPSLTTGYSYDDNVYLTDSDHKGDSIFAVNPKVSLLSQWSRNVLDLVAGMTQYEYASEYSNNRTDWNVGGLGHLDFTQGVTLTADGQVSEQHEARNSPNDPTFIARPVQFIQDHADATFTYRPYRFGYDIGATYDHFNYFATALNGGGVLDNRDRDENTYNAFISGYYEVYQGLSAFVRATRTVTDYSLEIDRTGVNRSSVGDEYDSGFKVLFSNLLSGEAFLGYLSHDYHDPLPNVSGFDFGGKIAWNFTPLMTLHLAAARILADTTLQGTSTEDNKQFAIGLDYELLRNLIILTEGDYTISTFPGTPRRDKCPAYSVGTKYLINRYFSATAHLGSSGRESNAPGQSFNDLTVGLSLTAQL